MNMLESATDITKYISPAGAAAKVRRSNAAVNSSSPRHSAALTPPIKAGRHLSTNSPILYARELPKPPRMSPVAKKTAKSKSAAAGSKSATAVRRDFTRSLIV